VGVKTGHRRLGENDGRRDVVVRVGLVSLQVFCSSRPTIHVGISLL
jgi:hypothetical protein